MCTAAHQSNFSIHQGSSHSGPWCLSELYLCYTSPYTLFCNPSWVTRHPFGHAVLAWNIHFYSSLPTRFLTRYTTTLLGDVWKCVPLSGLSEGSKRLGAWVNSSLHALMCGWRTRQRTEDCSVPSAHRPPLSAPIMDLANPSITFMKFLTFCILGPEIVFPFSRMQKDFLSISLNV